MLAGKNVLLVGGEEAVMAEAAKTLVDAGAHAKTSRTAEEALQILENEQFELVIVDFLLNGMNAYDLCKCLEQKKLPVIASAHNPFINSINIATCRNVVAFLRKPFTVRDLVKTITAALSGKPGILARTSRFRQTG